MPTLNLGVVDVAYSDPEAKGAITTGEVAQVLEKKYHVMRVFYELYQKKIAEDLSASVAERLEAMLQGAPVRGLDNLSVDAISKLFNDYLSRDEWQRTTGQSILAAKEGISHRFKSVRGGTISARSVVSGKGTPAGKVFKRKRGKRPAFIDTGLYQASFKSWLSGQ